MEHRTYIAKLEQLNQINPDYCKKTPKYLTHSFLELSH